MFNSSIRDLEAIISQKFPVLPRDLYSYCVKNFLSIDIANASKTVPIDRLKPAYVDLVKLPKTFTRSRKRGRPRNKRDC